MYIALLSESMDMYLYPTKKKRIQYSLPNYSQLRIVDKIFIFERNFF